ncbi:MAG: serine--tRNA ligase, partial [Candidatus Saccharimonadales bacterium]
MLDIQFIRDNREKVQEKSKQKGYQVDVAKLLELDGKRRELLNEIDQVRAKRNNLAKTPRIGATDNKEKFKKQFNQQIEEGKNLKSKIAELESKLEPVEAEYQKLLKAVPNLPLDDVPVGLSEDENVVAKKVGEPLVYDFKPKQHHEIIEPKGLLDKERAAKIAGSRFG